MNASGAESRAHSGCNHDMSEWEEHMEKMYSYFYLLLFVPGLLLNTTALWVLWRHISKKSKTVIFMMNLALADLVHTLSLPLRIYYYFTHSWPFGSGLCLFCFYLKYLNMYAAISFLVCISVQRCCFLLDPFLARRWRRRSDLVISAVVWAVVGLSCSPFILMRSGASNTSDAQHVSELRDSVEGSAPPPLASSPKPSCFKDLPMRRPSTALLVSMVALAEVFGFLLPLLCIVYSSVRIRRSLAVQQNHAALQPKNLKHSDGEKSRALKMVLSCSLVFLLCFAPYHINFLLYMMVQQGILSHCPTRLAVLQVHPVSLCLASLSCCLNPLLYYFLTAEFRLHIRSRTSSFSSSLMSSPMSQRPRPEDSRDAPR
ncbi:putative P2Y purinoceptor 10 [Synchiropus splendidus]|uniref:putative P2Y purinoceptor 10 n=1 Tax=Synchiropus splendidus TaxID=270530 RepID=UPI00237D4E40|nr:putative P2Y purinoceptor 10 [Synchiropus splendidus]